MIVFIRLAQLKEQKFIISVIFTLCSYKSFCRKEIWSLAQHAYYFFFSVKEHFTFRYGQCSYLVIFFSLRLIAHSYRIYHKLSTKETLNFMEFISPRLTHRQIMLINSTLSWWGGATRKEKVDVYLLHFRRNSSRSRHFESFPRKTYVRILYKPFDWWSYYSSAFSRKFTRSNCRILCSHTEELV